MKFTEDDCFMCMNLNKPNDRPWQVMTLKQANARLEEMLKEAPVVEGCKNITNTKMFWTDRWENGSTVTHRARLVCIEEVK